jgi:hypothetical protein
MKWYHRKYTPEEWAIDLSKKVDPKAKIISEIPNLKSYELREKINQRLKLLKAEDLAEKFKGNTKARLVNLYTWLLVTLYDDEHHSWVFVNNIRKSAKKRFIPSNN